MTNKKESLIQDMKVAMRVIAAGTNSLVGAGSSGDTNLFAASDYVVSKATYLRSVLPAAVGPPDTLAPPVMNALVPENEKHRIVFRGNDIPMDDGTSSFADSWSMPDMSSTDAELLALRSSLTRPFEMVIPADLPPSIESRQYPYGTFGPVTSRANGDQCDREFPFPPSPPPIPLVHQQAERDAIDQAVVEARVAAELRNPIVVLLPVALTVPPPVVPPLLYIDIAAHEEILRIISDPIFSVAEKIIQARAVNSRQK